MNNLILMSFWGFGVLGFWGFGVMGFVADFMMRTSEGVASGTLMQLTKLLLIAILIGTCYRGKGDKLLHGMSIIIALYCAIMGLLSFSKTDIMQPVMMLILGLYLRSPNIKIILVSIVCVFSLLSYIAKPISEGRVSTFHGDLSFSDRLFVLINAFDKPGESEGGIWPRLAYTTAQFAAVDLYDIGQGGNDI